MYIILINVSPIQWTKCAKYEQKKFALDHEKRIYFSFKNVYQKHEKWKTKQIDSNNLEKNLCESLNNLLFLSTTWFISTFAVLFLDMNWSLAFANYSFSLSFAEKNSTNTKAFDSLLQNKIEVTREQQQDNDQK